MDATENTNVTAEMLANIGGTTRVPKDVQLELLEDAIHVEELGIPKRANECAEQATSLPTKGPDCCIARKEYSDSQTGTKDEA